MRFLALISVCFFAFSCTKKLDTDKKKASYQLGIQIATNLKNQKIDFDTDAFYQAVKDVQAGKEPRLTPEEGQAAMRVLQEELNKLNQAEAETNKAASQAFLEKNKSAEGVRVTPSGLQYQILKEGTGRSPKPTDRVRVHYRGTNLAGQEFESTLNQSQPVEFPITGLMKGLAEGLQLVKIGGKIRLFLPPELAYGAGSRTHILPHSVLIFEIELFDIPAEKKKP